ncbi:MAG TPA: phosphatidate cytidylyltransferase [Candidatus Acidoferrales bacterium]|nr:phosphatidate cytidylyltransferase [Candidatus Acidoferrales bacterium]
MTTALVTVPLLVLVIAAGQPWHFASLVLAVTFIALREYYRIVFPDYLQGRLLGLVLGLFVAFGMMAAPPVDPILVLVISLLASFIIYLLLQGKLSTRFERLMLTLVGTFYLSFFIPHFMWLYELRNGKEWVFLVLSVIMSGDAAAYFVGRSYGRRKLAAELSPNKTVEGAWASLAAALAAGLIGGRYLLPEISLAENALVAVILNVLGQLGDLFESWIKRVFSVKDSGSWLPGHGGILDRIDSLIFPTVFTTYYVRLLH